MAWVVTVLDEGVLPDLEVHVYPTIDLRDHALTAFCWCRPQPECGEAGLVWVHHERLAQAAAGRVGRD
jgi:hypothetical protein